MDGGLRFYRYAERTVLVHGQELNAIVLGVASEGLQVSPEVLFVSTFVVAVNVGDSSVLLAAKGIGEVFNSD